MNKPNLFQIATSELSQDGFFTWLISWADGGNAQHNPELHKVAQGFVRLLLGKADDFEITKVIAKRQYEKIDIWVAVNDAFNVIIEDKTNTGQHSHQLARYREIAQAFCEKNNRQLVCVYLKTGNESKASLAPVSKNGYTIIDRAKLVGFFEKHHVQNDIYTDFVSHLKSIDERGMRYRTLPVGEWTYTDWEGFYQLLENKLNVGGWNYVANASGGFLGLYWCHLWVEHNNSSPYLQIEQGDLCFKVSIDGKDRRKQKAVRTEWFSTLMRIARQEGRSEIRKPARFGAGTTMTCAIVRRMDWLGADNDLLDEEAVVARLKGYEQFLDKCVKACQN